MKITKIEPAFVDERGSIWDFLTNDEIHHVGFLISRRGSIRGKHYHKEQRQYTLVLNGKIRIVTKNLLENNSKIERFELNKMEMVLFPPFCYHSIESIEDSECLILTSKSRENLDYEKDTVRVADIESFKSKDVAYTRTKR
ncbi:MAG: WxcM-like domain-containing protein [Nitrososphaeraceae archaeon]